MQYKIIFTEISPLLLGEGHRVSKKNEPGIRLVKNFFTR
jgi:hypothetical protein